MSTPPSVMDSRYVDEPSATSAQRFRHDDKLYASFGVRPVFNQFASNEAGRPIYLDREFITIIVPGDKHSVIMRQIRQQDIQRFPKQYQAFKQGKEEQQQGTPLTIMPWMPPSRAEEYKFFKIVTVEQLASAPDEVGKNFMGFQNDKQKAQEYLDASQRGVGLQEMEVQLAQRDGEIALLKKQMEELLADKVEKTGVSTEEVEESEEA
jgi:hypothetical protein